MEFVGFYDYFRYFFVNFVIVLGVDAFGVLVSVEFVGYNNFFPFFH